MSAFTWGWGARGRLRDGPPAAPPPRGFLPGEAGEPHLGGRHQLGRAGRDLVGADNELLVLARVQHHLVRRLPGGKAGRAWVSDPSPNPEHPHPAPSTPPPGLGQHTPVGWLPSPPPWRQRSGLRSTSSSWHKIPAAWLPPSGDRRTGRTSQGCHQGDTRSPGVSPSPLTQPQGCTLDHGGRDSAEVPRHAAGPATTAHFRGLMPKKSPWGNLKPRGDLGQRGLWGQAPCRNLSSMAELCGLPTKEGAPPGPARDAPSHQ